MTMENKGEYPRASDSMVFGGTLIYVAGMFLLVSFASPYWVESYEGTFSNFKHMGLWEYCFDQFRFPYHQFDKMFSGCHYVYSFEFHIIREWLLPAWLLAIQTFVTLALILSFGAQILAALTIIRYPLKFVLKYEWLLSGFIFVATAICVLFLFLAVVVFWTQSSRRDWLMYPNFNHVSWSYYFCAASFFLHAIAALILYKVANAYRKYIFHFIGGSRRSLLVPLLCSALLFVSTLTLAQHKPFTPISILPLHANH